MNGNCSCGCGEKTTITTKNLRRSGYPRGTSQAFIQGHGARKIIETKESDSGCLTLKNHKPLSNGYLRIQNRRVGVQAHRWAFELAFGSIPSEFVLDHLCRNRSCINPNHLEIVTGAENVQRGINIKLDHRKASEIRDIYKDGELSQYAIAKMFGVSRGTVYDTIKRITWK